ncbi:ABC transporter ATP-binding protein [Thermodesulfobacteriota bacterium B35]
MSGPVLQLAGVGRSFGGLQVCHGIDLALEEGGLHALIGPNGAGKTTLLDIITGLLAADSGRIIFRGRDISRLPVHRRARLGMARSFQVSSLLPSFTVREHLALAVLAGQGSGYRFWRPVASDPALQEPAGELMARVGLMERAGVRVEALAHGERRLLEIAMALATGPELLLLDEPMAGLGPASARELAGMIPRLKASLTILLVEHDMKAVFALADRITVLVRGEVMATGRPEEIRNHGKVQEAYLGSPC